MVLAREYEELSVDRGNAELCLWKGRGHNERGLFVGGARPETVRVGQGFMAVPTFPHCSLK